MLYFKLLVKQSKFYFLLSLLAVCILYSAITLPALLQKSHVLYNLEPYPDGLLYALSARNFAMTGEFALRYQDTQLAFWTQPLYSLLLIPMYLLNSQPQVFFVSNYIMGLSTLILVSLTLWKRTKNIVLVLLGQLILLSHGYFIWVAQLPMAENAVLLLVALLLYVLLNTREWQLKNLLLCGVIAAGLALTKYTLIPVAAGVCTLCLWWYSKDSHYTYKKSIFAALLSIPLVVAFFLGLVGQGVSFIQGLQGENAFFSTNYIATNLLSYAQKIAATTAIPGAFLWSTTPLTSLALVATGIVSLLVVWRSSQLSERRAAVAGVVIIILQLPLLLLFYVSDARYVIGLLIPLAVFIPLAGASIIRKKSKLLFAWIVVVFSLQIFAQYPLYKEIIASNLFGRSNAWQQQSILHFNRFMSTTGSNEKPQTLITALPPFLVTAYQTSTYSLLPLSQHQEFLAKNEFVWGTQIEYTNLHEMYKKLLAAGTPLYISNAYVTQQQSVITDFELIKENFTLQVVSEGCDHACDIFEIQLKQGATQ
jgi:hypothetical protein